MSTIWLKTFTIIIRLNVCRSQYISEIVTINLLTPHRSPHQTGCLTLSRIRHPMRRMCIFFSPGDTTFIRSILWVSLLLTRLKSREAYMAKMWNEVTNVVPWTASSRVSWRWCMTLGIMGFWTSSVIRYSKAHCWVRIALSNGPNRASVSHPSPEEGNRSSFRNVVFFRIADDR
jgi:hypothetical protein